MAPLPWYRRLAPVHWLAIYCLIVGLISLVGADDFWVWFFEIYVGIGAVLILLFTYRRFQFSNLVYVLVAVHFTVLAIGAHYTYAKMPLFEWLKNAGFFSRNHYDRVGHFFQGFVPVMVAREILLRKTALVRGKMLNFISICIPLAFSAFWEILEAWIVILFYKAAGPDWLGWQGDVWDAQNDMLMCLIGAMLAIMLLSRLHDRSIGRVQRKERSIW